MIDELARLELLRKVMRETELDTVDFLRARYKTRVAHATPIFQADSKAYPQNRGRLEWNSKLLARALVEPGRKA